MKLRIVILGAGFGGLELTTLLSERIGDRIDLTLIDQNDTFYIGFTKLEVMFGRKRRHRDSLPGYLASPVPRRDGGSHRAARRRSVPMPAELQTGRLAAHGEAGERFAPVAVSGRPAVDALDEQRPLGLEAARQCDP